jgi:hypothetical protein
MHIFSTFLSIYNCVSLKIVRCEPKHVAVFVLKIMMFISNLAW